MSCANSSPVSSVTKSAMSCEESLSCMWESGNVCTNMVCSDKMSSMVTCKPRISRDEGEVCEGCLTGAWLLLSDKPLALSGGFPSCFATATRVAMSSRLMGERGGGLTARGTLCSDSCDRPAVSRVLLEPLSWSAHRKGLAALASLSSCASAYDCPSFLSRTSENILLAAYGLQRWRPLSLGLVFSMYIISSRPPLDLYAAFSLK
mmetsp:Transcript_32438/g.72855  ORF Transcript_32438/g.72855 Transcript_32438/m.72855 type:complete len:205 (+) Transcript_32438:1533-2147(+)